MSNRTIIREPTYPTIIQVVMTGYPPCDACGGAACADLDVNRSGFAAGISYLHAETCATLFCKHRVLHTSVCADCDAEEDRAADDLKGLRALAIDVVTEIRRFYPSCGDLADSLEDVGATDHEENATADDIRESLAAIKIADFHRIPAALRERVLVAVAAPAVPS